MSSALPDMERFSQGSRAAGPRGQLWKTRERPTGLSSPKIQSSLAHLDTWL
jgi:hypothetical protein